jgi:hypothetical protein
MALNSASPTRTLTCGCAYPDEYRNSGVMTFIVNHSGQVFE